MIEDPQRAQARLDHIHTAESILSALRTIPPGKESIANWPGCVKLV